MFCPTALIGLSPAWRDRTGGPRSQRERPRLWAKPPFSFTTSAGICPRLHGIVCLPFTPLVQVCSWLALETTFLLRGQQKCFFTPLVVRGDALSTQAGLACVLEAEVMNSPASVACLQSNGNRGVCVRTLLWVIRI